MCLVAELVEEITGHLLEGADVLGRHLHPPVAQARGQRMPEALLVRLGRHVYVARVVGHRRLVRKPGELRDAPEHRLDFADEVFVAHLEVALVSHAAAETPRCLHLGTPLTREPGRVARLHPGLRHQPLRHRKERQRCVASVANEVDEQRVRKEPLEQAEVLHVHRGLVAPARLAALRRVNRVHGRNGSTDRHPLGQTCAHPVQRHAPFRERVDPAQVVDELVGLDMAEVAVGKLWHEVRLVGNGELGVPVEHHAKECRSRAAHPEDEHGRAAGGRRHGRRTRTTTQGVGAERFPARSSATSFSLCRPGRIARPCTFPDQCNR